MTRLNYYCMLIYLYIYSQICVDQPYKRDIFLAFQTGGCFLLHESSAESYFNAAISNDLSIAISMSPEWVVA